MKLEKSTWRRLQKTILVCGGISVLVFVASIFLISPFAKYFVEKNSVKYTGRKITIGSAYANLFTGFVEFDSVRIYEAENDSLFLSATSISLDFTLIKLFWNTVDISEIIITQPIGVVINKEKHFNFDDLVVRFSPDPLRKKPARMHVNVRCVKILQGQITYRDKAIPISYLVRDLNMESSGKAWDADTIASSFSFLSQKGEGHARGNFMINPKSK